MEMEVIHRQIDAGGIELHVAECGEGQVVLCCHGFPELWYSWRHQLPTLAAAGYRAVAPDQRGYGRSEGPDAVEDYDIVHLGGDMVALLDALSEERAVVVGHDWGAIVTWYLARAAPERLWGVAALSVPFAPRPPRPPTEIWRSRFGDEFFYILHFQAPGVADAQLLAGQRDPVLQMIPVERMAGWVSDLRESALLPGAGHWIQQERPTETNEVLLRFLSSLELPR